MNRLNNLLLTVLFSAMLFLGGMKNIDTDRRVVPVFEKLKVFLMDIKAERDAATHGTMDSVVIVYNNGGHGTGFFITDRVLLTNHHMVAKRGAFGAQSANTNETVTIQLRNGAQHIAKVLKSNPDLDIAMLEIVGDYRSPHMLYLADKPLNKGDSVYIAGNGGFDFFWAKGGFLKGKFKFSETWNNNQQLAHMKSKGGFSGSPVVDSKTGQVVGVHAGGFVDPNTFLTIHVPLTDIKMFLKQTPREANPYATQLPNSVSHGWNVNLIRDSKRTGNFTAHAVHLKEKNYEQIKGYCKDQAVSMRKTSETTTFFNGDYQATSHLLLHIYFDRPLEVKQEEGKVVLSVLYIPVAAIDAEQEEVIMEFCEARGVTATLHEPSNRVIFEGPRDALIKIAEYVFRGKEL